MNAKTAAVLLSGLLVACAQTQPPNATPPAPAAAQPPAPAQAQAPATQKAQTAAPVQVQAEAAGSVPANHIVDIQRSRCQDLMRLSPDDREEASMFYIGYQAYTSGPEPSMSA
jgi:hypothetical protein